MVKSDSVIPSYCFIIIYLKQTVKQANALLKFKSHYTRGNNEYRLFSTIYRSAR